MQQSPLPKTKRNKGTEDRSFGDALQWLLEGHNIARRAWFDLAYLHMQDQKLMITKIGDGIHTLIVSEGDIRGTDWYVFQKTD